MSLLCSHDVLTHNTIYLFIVIMPLLYVPYASHNSGHVTRYTHTKMTACDLWQNKKSITILTNHHLKAIHFILVWWYRLEMYLLHFYSSSWTLLEIFMKSIILIKHFLSDSYTSKSTEINSCHWPRLLYINSPKTNEGPKILCLKIHFHTLSVCHNWAFMTLKQTCCDGQTLQLKPRLTWVSPPNVPINSLMYLFWSPSSIFRQFEAFRDHWR